MSLYGGYWKLRGVLIPDYDANFVAIGGIGGCHNDKQYHK